MKRHIQLFLLLIAIFSVVIGITSFFMGNQSDTENVSYQQAYTYVVLNSAPGIEFHLEKVFEEDIYAKYKIVPESKDNDEAWIYLKKDRDNNWNMIAFGTAFPGLYDAYPELMNR
jgi:hypothetical protein